VIGRLFGLPSEAVADLGALDQSILDKIETVVRSNRLLNWKIVQRGFWAHGVDNLRAFFASAELFTMKGRAALVSCPILITQAENDMLAAVRVPLPRRSPDQPR
jgi:hypothetical protein